MDIARSGSKGMKIARLCLGIISLLAVIGLVACAAEEQSMSIAAPSAAASSTFSVTFL